MWAVDSEAESELWNVHGLAHKVEFQAEYLHAQANQSMTQFPLYDPLDDNQIEDFRRRFMVNTFGFPAVPPPVDARTAAKFDERYLRPAQRHGGLGHGAEHGDRRRPGRGPPGHPPALADQARP